MSFPAALALLSDASQARLARSPVLVGLDGFVDTILHVVALRTSATEYVRLTDTRAFAARVAGAAGRSANFEFVPQRVKLGGNGPILADALNHCGVPITYLGNLGTPGIHPIFQDFAARCERVVSVAEPATTDAIEFEDGKLMCGQSQTLAGVRWDTLLARIPLDELRAVFARSALVALVNWTMILHATDLLRAVVREIAPTLPPLPDGGKRWLFLDLADPAKRSRGDVAELLGILPELQQSFRVILGLNFQESCQIGALLGLGEPGESPTEAAAHAARIRAGLGIETVVIHRAQFAAAAEEVSGTAHLAGPYTPRPVISTGAGDHFNAGFCLGRLLGGDLDASLALAVGVSGFYVRQAQSPTLAMLRDFIAAL